MWTQKPFFKRTSVIIGVVIVVAVVLYFWKPRAGKANTWLFFAQDVTVSTGNLETVLTLQWTTQFADSQKLVFLSKGKVKSVNVKVGDVVKKNQILAVITTDDLDNQVDQARINLDDAQQALQDLLDGYNLDLEYLQQKASYDALLLKQKTIDQDQALAKDELLQKLEDAKKKYRDTLSDYEELLSGSNSATADLALSSTIRKRNTTFQNAVLDLKNIISTVESALDAYDQLVLVSDKYSYLFGNTYIGAKDPSLKDKANVLFWELSTQLSRLRTLYKALEILPVQDITNDQILEAYTVVKNIWSSMVSRWETSYAMFKASIDGVGYSLSQIDADANTALKNQSVGISYIQKYSTMVDALAGLKDDTSLEDTKLSLDKAKTALDKLELQVDVLLVDQQKEKAKLLDDMDTIQRNIAKIQRGESLNESRIKQARNLVTQRQNSLNSLLDKYDDYRLKANFDGVVTQMDIQVGDSIDSASSNSSQKYIYVENNNVLEMALNVEQVDIIKLKQGMDVNVYLDAYPRSVYRGVISEINTIPSTNSSVVTYGVKVMFEKNFPEEVVLAGMGGNAKIILSRIENVLVVPNQAISRKDGKHVVRMLKGGAWVDQEVVLGSVDERNTEIVEGLQLWDTIKAMYITDEGMSAAGISLQSQSIDLQTLQQQNMRNMNAQFGGSATRGGWGNTNVQVRMWPNSIGGTSTYVWK